MKHLSILLAATAAVFPLVSSSMAADDYKGSWDTDAVYLVISKDAPDTMRRGGPNVWLCDGTADNVQIQAAIDKAFADSQNVPGLGYTSGNLVELSAGTFYLDRAAADIIGSQVSGTGNLFRKTAPLIASTSVSATMTGLAFDGAWTIADVEVGDLYDLRGGDRGGGVTMDDDFERFVGMVQAVTTVAADTGISGDGANPTVLTKAGIGTGVTADDQLYISSGTNATVGWYIVASATDDTITLTADAGTGAGADWVIVDAIAFWGNTHASYTYTAAVFTRIPFAIQLKKNVHFKGAGQNNLTILYLNSAQNCAVVSLECGLLDSAIQRGFQISDMVIHGKAVSQTVAATSPGIVAGYYTQNIRLDNVHVASTKGDLAWFGVGELVEIKNCIFSGGSAWGLCLGPGGPAFIHATGMYGSAGPGLVLHRTSSESVSVNGCTMRATGANWGAISQGAVSPHFTGNYFGPADNAGATELGGIYVSADSTNGLLTGNVFENQYGTAINNLGYWWVITGNHVKIKANGTPYANSAQYYPNTVVGNFGIQSGFEGVVSLALNGRGSAINTKSAVIRKAAVTADSTTVSSLRTHNILGICWTSTASAADAAWYSIVRSGRIDALYDDDDAATVGMPLCASAVDVGVLTKADTSGDRVVAVAEETSTGDGGDQGLNISLLTAEDRYLVP